MKKTKVQEVNHLFPDRIYERITQLFSHHAYNFRGKVFACNMSFTIYLTLSNCDFIKKREIERKI